MSNLVVHKETIGLQSVKARWLLCLPLCDFLLPPGSSSHLDLNGFLFEQPQPIALSLLRDTPSFTPI